MSCSRAAVVEQCRYAHNQGIGVAAGHLKRGEAVVVDVLVVPSDLLDAIAAHELWKHMGKKSRPPHELESPHRIASHQELEELFPYPFCGDEPYVAAQLRRRSLGRLVQREVEPACEAACAQHAQRVLAEPLLRIPDRPDHMVLQVPHAIVEVYDDAI